MNLQLLPTTLSLVSVSILNNVDSFSHKMGNKSIQIRKIILNGFLFILFYLVLETAQGVIRRIQKQANSIIEKHKMKKIIQLIFLLFITSPLFAAETLLLDFESATIPETVSSWLNYSKTGTSASTWAASNPKVDAINNTTVCYKIEKTSADPYWTGLEITLVNSISITSANQYLHVLVYKSTSSRIALTYTPESGSQSSDAWQSNSTTGAWIDYVLTIPVGTKLKTFSVKIADDAGDYYFDQISLSNVSGADTIKYGNKYSGQVPFQGKIYAAFKGEKDATIRFGYRLDRYVDSALVVTPSGNNFFKLTKSSYGVNEIKLPETGDYQIIISSSSSDDFGLWRTFSFVIYQMEPPVSSPDTINYGNKYSGQVPFQGKIYAAFKGEKDATIRFGYSLERYVDSALVVTPSGNNFFKLTKSSYGVNEIKLPESGDYQIIISSSSSDDFGLWLAFSFVIYQMFPSPNSKVLNLKDIISSKIALFAEPKVYQFIGAKNDLVYVKDFTAGKELQMILYDGFFQPLDTLISNKKTTLDVSLKRNETYYLVVTSSSNDYPVTFSYSFNLLPKYKIISYSTNKVGNYGKSTIVFEGNGFSDRTSIKLAKMDQDTIVADTLTINKYKCPALFNFNDKAKGKWDILVNFGDTIVTIKEGLEIEDYKAPEVVVELIGPKSVRPRRYTYYTIHYKNKGNVNAYQTPVFIQLTSDNEVPVLPEWEYIKLPFKPEFEPDPTDYYSTTKDIESGKTTKIMIPTIPTIPPGGEGTLTFGVNMTKPTEINVNAGSPMYYSGSDGTLITNQDFVDCIEQVTAIAKEQLVNFGIDLVKLPGLGCLNSTTQAIDDSYNLLAKSRGVIDQPLVGNLVMNYAFSRVDCAIDIVPELKPFSPYWEVFKLAVKGKLTSTINSCSKAINQGINGISANMVTSIDPNDKIGYRSPSGSNFFSKQNNFTYIINFENKSTATAPAQEVFITDTLDMNSFDINSFRAGYVRIGSKIVQAPVNVSENTWDVDMRPAMNLITRVELTLDKTKGIAHWYFKCIDPKTNDFPTDALVGFLPPNDSIGSGEGCVSFTIDLKETVKDESQVNNRATIVFDYNEPIMTPTWSNRKDAIAPTSSMFDPETVADHVAALNWDGLDNKNGSGIYCYNLYMKKNNGGYETLLSRTSKTSIEFAYESGASYSFYVTAIDSAENVEVKTNIPEVTINTTGVKTLQKKDEHSVSVFPNPNDGIFTVTTSYEGESQLSVTSISGQKVFGPVPFRQSTQVNLKGRGKGIYLCVVKNSTQVKTQKMEIK